MEIGREKQGKEEEIETKGDGSGITEARTGDE